MYKENKPDVNTSYIAKKESVSSILVMKFEFVIGDQSVQVIAYCVLLSLDYNFVMRLSVG